MAVNTTYSSILNEIQLSNLNYSIQMTPFASYITLKKSVQKDLAGVPATPSPPILFLLQTSQQENHQLREENFRLKSAFEMQKRKLEKIKLENECLDKTVEESNISVKALNTTITNLQSQINAAKTELEKNCADKTNMNDKAKEAKKKHFDEVSELKVQVETLKKNLKVKDKTIYDLSQNLNNARNIIKNLKSEKSQLKMSKTKLTGEIRKLEKKLVEEKSAINLKKCGQHATLNSVGLESKTYNENKNVTTLRGSMPIPSIPSPANPLYSSMITHWNPLPLEISSSATIVAHTVKSQASSCSLWSAQEFQEMLDKMCERVFAKLGWDKYQAK